MEKEILRCINTQCLGSGLCYIAGNMNQITIVQPVAGYLQLTGLGLMTDGMILYLVIVGSRHTKYLRQRILLGRSYSNIHTSSIQHQRRKIRLERMRYIIPRPTRSPIDGIHHRHIGRQCIRNVTDTASGNNLNQRIQILVHELRIETTHQVKTTLQSIVHYPTGVLQTGIHRIIRTQPSQCRYGSDDLLGRCRSVQFLVLVTEKRFAGSEIEYSNTDLRSFQ